jgi:hypothetical protein
MGDSLPQMARRKTTPQRLPDAVRDAVERTIQATLGGAEQTRGRAQEALDDVVSGAEAIPKNVRARVREVIETTRPATSDDIKELRAEIRALSRRLDAMEKKPAAKPRTAAKSRTAAKRSSGRSK